MMGNAPVDLNLISLVYLQFEHIQSLIVDVVCHDETAKIIIKVNVIIMQSQEILQNKYIFKKRRLAHMPVIK